MADAAPAVVKKAAKKTSKPKVPAAHPKYSVMVAQAIGALKERGGSSRAAVLKYILKNFKVGNNETAVNSHLKLALKAGVKAGSLKQAKGTGASGSFKLGEKPKAAKPKKAAKKPAAKKAAKPKKAKSPKKPAAKTAKSPKKAKKPAAAKKPKSPKKAAAAKKPVTKKPAAKKPVAKKPAAKKPAAKKTSKKWFSDLLKILGYRPLQYEWFLCVCETPEIVERLHGWIFMSFVYAHYAEGAHVCLSCHNNNLCSLLKYFLKKGFRCHLSLFAVTFVTFYISRSYFFFMLN